MVHDFSKDNGLTPNDLFALAERYHAFSGSELQAFTLPTAGAYSSVAGDVEVVQPDAAAQMITQFLGGDVGPIVTPPLDSYGNPMTLPVTTTPSTAATPTSVAQTAPTAPSPTTTVPAPTIPSYDPRPC